jgi:hypothetical protein
VRIVRLAPFTRHPCSSCSGLWRFPILVLAIVTSLCGLLPSFMLRFQSGILRPTHEKAIGASLLAKSPRLASPRLVLDIAQILILFFFSFRGASIGKVTYAILSYPCFRHRHIGPLSLSESFWAINSASRAHERVLLTMLSMQCSAMDKDSLSLSTSRGCGSCSCSCASAHCPLQASRLNDIAPILIGRLLSSSSYCTAYRSQLVPASRHRRRHRNYILDSEVGWGSKFIFGVSCPRTTGLLTMR